MPDAYHIHEGKFLQKESNGSGADALYISSSLTPPGRVRTILAAYIQVSAAETQTYWFAVVSQGSWFPITAPTSRTITPAVSQWVPLVTEGMEVKLFPGEALQAHRAAATAGSSITIVLRFIETDMPIYEYVEPQLGHRVRRSAMSSLITRRGGGGGGVGGPGGSPGGGGGGGGGPLPV